MAKTELGWQSGSGWLEVVLQELHAHPPSSTLLTDKVFRDLLCQRKPL